ncbi:sensor histidine kinase [Shimia sp. SDUM112013]|uniref:sensor histidine kinase n=1 Tax=Shimia sp. SDUM112013 TaxID=3136160 RepID=UPI0032EF408E
MNWIKTATRSLTFRIAVLLAVAMLPVGMISIEQNRQLLKDAEERQYATLLAMTSEAADREAAYATMAFGAAQALAAISPTSGGDPASCAARLSRFLETSHVIAFIGVIDADGRISCATSPQQTDMSDHRVFQAMRDDPSPRASFVRRSAINKDPAVVISVPILSDGAFDGLVAIVLKHAMLSLPQDNPANENFIDLIAFNADGEVLASSRGLEDVARRLPANNALQNLARIGKTVFVGTNSEGAKRVFAAVPIIQGEIYALSSWEHDRGLLLEGQQEISTSLMIPLGMWMAGLLVAFLSVQVMVLSPIRDLRLRMQAFRKTRQIGGVSRKLATPSEIIEMDETWQDMAESILRDEADLVNSLHQKSVLLKEVHHRVKNNLQLVASILNLKIRKTRSEAEKTGLVEIQQRVMRIAHVHQKLYETTSEERIRADELLATVVNNLVDSALVAREKPEIHQSYDQVVLYPDQAVPLSLALSELATNAMKYMGAGAGETAWLSVRLTLTDEKMATLEVANSIGPTEVTAEQPESTGLGDRLVRAFTQQLEGQLDTMRDEDGVFRVLLTFEIADFVEEDPQSDGAPPATG